MRVQKLIYVNLCQSPSMVLGKCVIILQCRAGEDVLFCCGEWVAVKC